MNTTQPSVQTRREDKTMKALRIVAFYAIVAGGIALNAVQAQTGIGRTDLLQSDLSAEGLRVVQVRVDFGRGAVAAAHNHPGEEVAFVLEGTLEYQLAGQPPVTLSAGQSLFIPAGTVHTARNVGSGKAAELATYIVAKGQPLISLAR